MAIGGPMLYLCGFEHHKVFKYGRGFPDQDSFTGAARPSLGLAGMRERIAAVSGSVSFTSEEGAMVTVTIPLENAS